MNTLNKKITARKKSIVCIFGLAICIGIMCGVFVYGQKSPKETFVFPPLNPIQMPKVEQMELPNGLQLFLVEDHEYPTIDMHALVRTGSIYEPKEKVGLAALTGRVLRTGGTVSKTGDEIDKELESIAARIEVFIGQTSGNINVSLLKEDLDQVLGILADILMNPAFREDKITLAKIMEKSSISRRNDDIGQITRREFRKLIYGKDSPYARLMEYSTIDAVTREDIVKFYETFFHPNNTIMAVWGDFNSKEMATKLEKTLGAWKGKDVMLPPIPEVKYDYKYTVNFIDKPDVNQSNIMLGHIGGLMNDPDIPALSVMNSILSYERMFKKIRTDEGLAYSVWGVYGAEYQYPGIFTCGAQTKSESTVYAIELMLEELKRITRDEVSDEELAKAKDEYLNGYVFNFDSRAKIVNRMMAYAYYGYPLDFMEKIRKEVEKVTKKDVLRVAKKYLQPDKVQILVVGNKETFVKPLSTLGEVNNIDISIPTPEKTANEEK
ncbi:MAG: insulinase family protein [Candidatus Aminicenantes bacterium]|nr:insulinase family protein [Candidatus Aminicenantes bacterium]